MQKIYNRIIKVMGKNMKITMIVGARPQFVKASVLYKAMREKYDITLVHTGQHYDDNMSKIFFEELNLPAPDINLNIGSGGHGEQTGAMLTGIEKILLKSKPDAVMILGDTNSTLAGALAASKLLIPIAHVEAGLRNFDKQMPEEQNRICTDHLSDMLFCPTQTAVDWLAQESITRHVFNVGDVMYDVVLQFSALSEKKYLTGSLFSGTGLICTLSKISSLVKCGESIFHCPSKVSIQPVVSLSVTHGTPNK